MAVTFDPETRLIHLKNYVGQLHQTLTFEEAKIQLLRVRILGYRLVADLGDERYDRSYVDDMVQDGYKTLSKRWERDVKDPFEEPCKGQYELLSELRSYIYWDRAHPFITFIRYEFKKVFIPSLRLMTELCRSENKYSWEDVKFQLQDIMNELEVTVDWEESEANLGIYLQKISGLLEIGEETHP